MSETFTPNDFDDDRVTEFGAAILECINDFQNEHHAGKLKLQESNWETLVVLASVLSFTVSSIDCDDCRKNMARQTLRNLKESLPYAIDNPAHPGAGNHTH